MNEMIKLAFWLRTVSQGVEVTDYDLLVEMVDYLDRKWFAWYQDLMSTDNRKYRVFDELVFDDILGHWDISRFYK